MLGPSSSSTDDDLGHRSAIMESLDSALMEDNRGGGEHPGCRSSSSSLPDVLSNELQSLSLTADEQRLSFRLLDDEERLMVESEQAFAAKLACDAKEADTKVKTKLY